ncbi:hypothetical protein DYB37_002982 [Aphanomyces astaci]|uniref:Intimal thickness related receptor IRP domain-containing protein n=1 Tax=Aphanomyces astaci TaxID=112090 RepID=A0A3R7E920_APHAT|nr:hypothetical protein DYB35_004978 [Aphanomyces astaci]RHZ22264.1 hypothetical protein DYB37_002982 [Aphanomyces astaci]
MQWVLGIAATVLCAVVSTIFIRRHITHVINPLAQTISMRCAIALGLSGVLFLAKMALDTNTSLQFQALQVAVEATAASVDSIVLVSAYFLVIVQLGGTERAIDVLAKHPPQHYTLPPTPAFDSPRDDDASTQGYDQVRHARATYVAIRRVVLWFAFVHPTLDTLGAIHDVAVRNDSSDNNNPTDTAIRVVLALCNLGATVLAVLTWVKLVKGFDADIAPKFKLKGKGVIVLGYLLLRCGQWGVYEACVPPVHRHQYGWFWTLCLIQLAILTVGFSRVFAPSTFHAMSHGRPALGRVWDVFQHPVPQCRTLHDTLATEFAGGASTKQIHESSVEY